MNLNLFRTYVKVVETQNLSRTADEFELSQPAITKQIQTLEEHYGILLLERTGRRLKPTEAGEALYHLAKDVIKAVEKTNRAMEELTESRKGSLVLGASSIPGHYILPVIMKNYKEQHPEVAISLEVSDTEKISSRVADREIDVGIVGGMPSSRKVEGFKWLDDELLVVVPSSHRLADQQEVSLLKLISEKWIIREKGSGTRKAFEDLLVQKGLKREDLNVSIEAGSTETVMAMVEAGMGVSIVSKWALSKAEASLKVVFLRLDKESEANRSFFVIYPRQKNRRRTVTEFLNYIRQDMQPESAAVKPLR